MRAGCPGCRTDPERVEARRPTSVALEERTIRRLKIVAKEQGIPYQVVMRNFITYELEAMKKARDMPWNQLMRTPLTQMMR